MPTDPERPAYAAYPDTPGVEFLGRARETGSFDAHMHESYTISVTLEGVEEFWCRGAAHAAARGDIALLNPLEVHKGGPGSAGYWSYRVIYVHPAVLDSLADDVRGDRGNRVSFSSTVVSDPALAAELGSLQSAMKCATSTSERKSLLLRVLGTLIVRHSTARGDTADSTHEPKAIRIAREYLHANYAAAVRLHDLSAICGLSPYHLLRTFHRAVGMPPLAYLRQIRVETAKHMLVGGMPISQVALASGFSDQSHLTRLFRNILGMTPGDYAAGLRSSAMPVPGA